MTEIERLLREVIARPAEDLPRLLYADAVEERDRPGDAERAAFIRRMVARPDWYYKFHRYTDGTWSRHSDDEASEVFLSFPAIQAMPVDSFVEIRRGFISAVRTELVNWVGGYCPICLDVTTRSPGRPVPCRRCFGTQLVPSIGVGFVAGHPIQRVEIMDSIDWVHNSADWIDRAIVYQNRMGPIWPFLKLGQPERDRVEVSLSLRAAGRYAGLREEWQKAAQRLAERVNVAALDWARHAAGLPPLTAAPGTATTL